MKICKYINKYILSLLCVFTLLKLGSNRQPIIQQLHDRIISGVLFYFIFLNSCLLYYVDVVIKCRSALYIKNTYILIINKLFLAKAIKTFLYCF